MSHQKILAILLVAVLVCAALAGCAAKGAPAAAWDAAGVEPEYLTQLPDNAFTEKIVPPQVGALDYVLDHSDSGRYAVFFKDSSSEDSAAYVDALKSIGYTELQSAANDVSTGTMLERDDAYLSVSYSDGVLGVLITLRSSAK